MLLSLWYLVDIELLKFSLTDDYSNKTAMYIGELYKYENEWKFAALGEGTNDNDIKEMIRRYS